jgi:hypothetical protein
MWLTFRQHESGFATSPATTAGGDEALNEILAADEKASVIEVFVS